MPYSNIVNPVALPPGRAKLATKLAPTGSTTIANTIGTVRVACSNAATVVVPLAPTRTSGVDAANSAACLRRSSALVVAQRCSSAHCVPRSSPIVPALFESRGAGLRFRVVRGRGHEHTDPPHSLSCARGRDGQATAPPTRVMNSRRLYVTSRYKAQRVSWRFDVYSEGAMSLCVKSRRVRCTGLCPLSANSGYCPALTFGYSHQMPRYKDRHSAKVKTLSATRLRKLLKYTPATGVFRWRVGMGGGYSGAVAGCIRRSNGYRVICVDGKLHQATRLAWLYMTGKWPKLEINCINRHRSDTRWANLRQITPSQRRAYALYNNKRGARGVSIRKSGKFIAIIKVDGEKKYLGTFITKKEASAAYARAAKDAFGQFAKAR